MSESRLSGAGSVNSLVFDKRFLNNGQEIPKDKLIRVEAMADIGNSSSNTAAAEKTSLALRQISSLYGGDGRGSMLPSSRHTAWGLMNAVTEYVDHYRRARSQDYRLDSAWFGQGALLKQKAMTQVQTLLQ